MDTTNMAVEQISVSVGCSAIVILKLYNLSWYTFESRKYLG
jgi:hypothetical protein